VDNLKFIATSGLRAYAEGLQALDPMMGTHPIFQKVFSTFFDVVNLDTQQRDTFRSRVRIQRKTSYPAGLSAQNIQVDYTPEIGVQVIYHSTPIVNFTPNDGVVLRTGGWNSVTTAKQIEQWLNWAGIHCRLYHRFSRSEGSRNGTIFIEVGGKTWVLPTSMSISYEGQVELYLGEPHEGPLKHLGELLDEIDPAHADWKAKMLAMESEHPEFEAPPEYEGVESSEKRPGALRQNQYLGMTPQEMREAHEQKEKAYELWKLEKEHEFAKNAELAKHMRKFFRSYIQSHEWEILSDNGSGSDFEEVYYCKRFAKGIMVYAYQGVELPEYKDFDEPPLMYDWSGEFFTWDEIFSNKDVMEEMERDGNNDEFNPPQPETYLSYVMTNGWFSFDRASLSEYEVLTYLLKRMEDEDAEQAPYNERMFYAPAHWPEPRQKPDPDQYSFTDWTPMNPQVVPPDQPKTERDLRPDIYSGMTFEGMQKTSSEYLSFFTYDDGQYSFRGAGSTETPEFDQNASRLGYKGYLQTDARGKRVYFKDEPDAVWVQNWRQEQEGTSGWVALPTEELRDVVTSMNLGFQKTSEMLSQMTDIIHTATGKHYAFVSKGTLEEMLSYVEPPMDVTVRFFDSVRPRMLSKLSPEKYERVLHDYGQRLGYMLQDLKNTRQFLFVDNAVFMQEFEGENPSSAVWQTSRKTALDLRFPKTAEGLDTMQEEPDVFPDEIVLHNIQGISRKSGTDQHGAQWIEFDLETVDPGDDGAAASSCAICHEPVWQGWMCLDGGDEVCPEHVVFESDLSARGELLSDMSGEFQLGQKVMLNVSASAEHWPYPWHTKFYAGMPGEIMRVYRGRTQKIKLKKINETCRLPDEGVLYRVHFQDNPDFTAGTTTDQTLTPSEMMPWDESKVEAEVAKANALYDEFHERQQARRGSLTTTSYEMDPSAWVSDKGETVEVAHSHDMEADEIAHMHYTEEFGRFSESGYIFLLLKGWMRVSFNNVSFLYLTAATREWLREYLETNRKPNDNVAIEKWTISTQPRIRVENFQIIYEGPASEAWDAVVSHTTTASQSQALLLPQSQSHELQVESDWHAYLQNKQCDPNTFFQYARPGQIWSFVREGQGPLAGKKVTRFVHILDTDPVLGHVHGKFGYDKDTLFAQSGYDGSARPMADRWSDVRFVTAFIPQLVLDHERTQEEKA
jgi:hypothetical protein